MKKIVFILLTGMVLLTTGCNNNTYSNLRNQEDKLIANYIKRNNWNILTKEPADSAVWGEKDYYKVQGYDNFYFHLIERGDEGVDVFTNDVIIVRYKQFALTENADTLSYWTTLEQPYPYEFHYGNYTDCEAVAWHAAVKLMKHPNAQCEILVPSKLGFNAEQTSVTPYMYILKIKVKQ